jgi:hypothetical protein
MQLKKVVSVVFLFAFEFSFAQNPGNIPLQTSKFITGDNREWSKPDFIDTSWKEIRTGRVWQQQGFPDYHGYAWYRMHVVIPSSLKNSSTWKDSLRIYLAHVNDVDETFLNGVKIGQIGGFPDDPSGYNSKWPFVREYHIAANNPIIKWDRENIIAIRVYDGGGSGGIFMGEPYVDMLEKFDGIEIGSGGGYRFLEKTLQKELSVSNKFNTTTKIKFHYSIFDGALNRQVADKTLSVELKPFETKKIPIEFQHKQAMELSYDFVEQESQRNKKFTEIAPYILTPRVPDAARINGPDVFGVRPGSPFFYKIPATGKGAISYSVNHLPTGLKVDSRTGIISGVLKNKGDYSVELIAKNAQGESKKIFTIKAGDLLALTPPMGWNSWNCWGLSVSDEKVKSSAQAMIDKGLVNHGWMYMNIDDGWELPQRTADGKISANQKFPDMKSLGDFLHGNGLRFGIYSSPGATTCGGFLGSYQHEEQDAASYAGWGIDYLNYDLCSYLNLIGRNASLDQHQKPYMVMRDALKQQSRDIVYSLCQYGIQEVWKWGEEVNGNLWRTTGDITDTWESLSNIGFNQDKTAPYAKPGRWNDPDMLIVGMVGWGENLHPTRLTPDEQYTHISLWSLLSAPLLLGCDLSKLDDFTLNLLTNDEVLAIDQDPLGKEARQVLKKDSLQVWVKDLKGGTKAVGIFNMSKRNQTIDLNWRDINLNGRFKVRDLWRQKDLGLFADKFSPFIPSHGCTLIKVSGK